MKTSNQNLITSFFQMVIREAKKLLPQERAVRVWDIMSFVQTQLELQGTMNEYGDVIPNGYVMDVYIDDAGTFAIVTRDGKLFKIPVFVDDQSQMTLGEAAEVYMEFSPVTRQLDSDGKLKPSVRVQRQADGAVRWYAMPACTAFLNRSGEIDSRKLFDSFVEYAERQNDFPELDFYHLGERLVLGKADMLFRDGVNFCATGLFDESDIARAAAQSIEDKGGYWGLSIAYLPTKDPEKIRSTEGVEIPVFNDGICRFISLLPEDTAASILTSISTEKEVNRMNDAQRKALQELTGGDNDLFKTIEGQLKENNRVATQPGVVVRQTAPAPIAQAQTPAPATPSAPLTKREIGEAFLEFLGSDEFKGAVKDAVTEARKADGPDEEDEEETETADTEEAVATPVAEARSKNPTLEAKVDALLAQMEAFGKSREASVEEVLADLPAKVARARIVRPRGAATMLPESLNTKERQSLDLAEIAEQTLSKIDAG